LQPRNARIGAKVQKKTGPARLAGLLAFLQTHSQRACRWAFKNTDPFALQTTLFLEEFSFFSVVGVISGFPRI